MDAAARIVLSLLTRFWKSFSIAATLAALGWFFSVTWAPARTRACAGWSAHWVDGAARVAGRRARTP